MIRIIEYATKSNMTRRVRMGEGQSPSLSQMAFSRLVTWKRAHERFVIPVYESVPSRELQNRLQSWVLRDNPCIHRQWREPYKNSTLYEEESNLLIQKDFLHFLLRFKIDVIYQ